jgi:hypothetical protein
MSALPPKADIAERDRHVRFVPKADIVRSITSDKEAKADYPISACFKALCLPDRLRSCGRDESNQYPGNVVSALPIRSLMFRKTWGCR